MSLTAADTTDSNPGIPVMWLGEAEADGLSQKKNKQNKIISTKLY